MLFSACDWRKALNCGTSHKDGGVCDVPRDYSTSTRNTSGIFHTPQLPCNVFESHVVVYKSLVIPICRKWVE